VRARVVLGGQIFVIETGPLVHASLAQAGAMVRAVQLLNADVRR
jgi:hypothetical protein